MRYKIFIQLLLCVLLSSCNEEELGYYPEPEISDRNAPKTIIAYLIGENNLSSYLNSNVVNMINGYHAMRNDSLCNFIIYYDDYRSPRLYELKYNPKRDRTDTLCIKRYNERNSLEETNINEVLSFIRAHYNTPEYGFIWGSHGSGWIPATKRSRALGPDGTDYLELPELWNAIPEGMYFEFMLFDACFLGQAETVNLFANKARYIIASPTEVPGNGFPYDRITKLLCTAESVEDYSEICKTYVDFYRSRWYSISLYDNSRIDEVAAAFKSILSCIKKYDLGKIDLNRVQHLDRKNDIIINRNVTYDLLSLARHLVRIKNTPEMAPLLQQLEEAVSRLIPYTAYTEFLNGLYITEFCGISTYWPQNDLIYINEFYVKNFDWASNSGLDMIIDMTW